MNTERIPARYMAKTEDGKDIWVTNISALTETELLEHDIDTFDETEDAGDEYKWIQSLLKDSIDNGLEVEVVQFALMAMKDDPRLTPAMAFRCGYLEWVK